MKRKQPSRRNPVARSLRILRHRVKPNAKVYSRKGSNTSRG